MNRGGETVVSMQNKQKKIIKKMYNRYYESTRIRQKSTESEKATTGYFPWKKLKVKTAQKHLKR